MIDSIEFKNFKILRDARIELGPFNLIIGPNGSGKTSVIEAIRRLRSLSSLAPASSAATPEAGSARLSFAFSAPYQGLAAVLTCTPDLSCDGIQLHGDEPAIRRWSEVVSRAGRIRFHTLDPIVMAKPCRADAKTELSENGSNLPAAIAGIRAANIGGFERLVSEFTRILPEFSSIETSHESGELSLEFGLRGEKFLIKAADLSQGALSLLGVLVISCTTPPPSLLCIEEIDRGLHPRVLREARDALYRLSHPEDGSPSCQVLATTHSPYLLDLFKDNLGEVIIAEKQGARARFVKLSERDDLRELMSEASLGDLWFSGVLGGVPEDE